MKKEPRCFSTPSPTSIFTSRRHIPRGSIKSNSGLRKSNATACAGHLSPRSLTSRPKSPALHHSVQRRPQTDPLDLQQPGASNYYHSADTVH
jgi:hypothetical protein